MGYTLLKQAAPLDWEEMLGESDEKAANLVHLPKQLIEHFEEFFESNTKYVLIAEGEKFTPNLKSMVDAYPECDYTITTTNSAYTAILERVFQGYRNVRVVTTSIYEYEFLQERFDLSLSVPTFGSRLLVDREQHFMCREHEMVALENLLHLGPSGRLAILLPARITFAGGNVKGLRNFISDAERGGFELMPKKYIGHKKQEVTPLHIVRRNYMTALEAVRAAESKVNRLLIEGGYAHEQ